MSLSAPPLTDVVEALAADHIAARHVLSLAQGLARGSATDSCAHAARLVAEASGHLLPRRWAEADACIAPRLRGRHRVVDAALDALRRHRLALEAPLARLAALSRLLGRDASRLHALRFELAAAAADARAALDAHHALEESIVFPALRRLLAPDELAELGESLAAHRLAPAA